MISYLDPASELFLADVARTQRQLAEASGQVSSGKRISAASDAPDQIDSLLQLHTSEVRNQQIRSNMSLATTEAAVADSTLASAIKLLDRALVLASQGANTTMDASGRLNLAQEVQSLHEQIVAYSNTTVQGRYIFSGDNTAEPAYITSTAVPVTGVARLSNAPATIRIEDAAGGSFAAAQPAREIFDARDSAGNVTSSNVFAALNGLRLALQANDTTAVGKSLAAIQDSSYHLNSAQAFYGRVQRRIENATDHLEKFANEVKAQMSQKEDADVVSASLELSLANTQLQAAFQMRARLPTRTLFDYLA